MSESEQWTLLLFSVIGCYSLLMITYSLCEKTWKAFFSCLRGSVITFTIMYFVLPGGATILISLILLVGVIPPLEDISVIQDIASRKRKK